MEQLIADGWPLGWIPSSSDQADFGPAGQGLLRMDNLTLDEKGTLRLINRSTSEINTPLAYAIHSIYGAYITSKKLRYTYDANGDLRRNYGVATDLKTYDLLIGSGGTTLKAAFLNTLGHVIACAGSVQYKDRGDIQWPLTIPKPVAPTITSGSYSAVSMSNAPFGTYTLWVSVESSAFDSSGTDVEVTTDLGTNRFITNTVYASPIDTTDFGSGTGLDAPTDTFTFSLELDNTIYPTAISIEFLLNVGPTTDSFFITIGLGQFGSTNAGIQGIPPFNLTPGVPSIVTIPRSVFIRSGVDSSLGWATVKSTQITVLGNGTIAAILKDFNWNSGVTITTQQYVCVELNNTGQFIEYSIASDAVGINASSVGVHIARGTACNAQSNQIRFYRNNVIIGQYLEVHREMGSYGFTPAGFQDTLTDNDALAQAAVDTDRILQNYRTQLPTTIIGMINFAGRVIYLTTSSFIPSFQLDFGSYDSRFVYELVGTNSEQCLFITKLSVGTFIVATTADFYQVTGTFSQNSLTNPDGTVVIIQDVNILPLGISDPAINSSFAEVEGNIYYLSSNGIRSMSNGTSTSLNSATELLFRNESRYGVPPVSLLPNDASLMGIVISGTRTYFALPFANTENAVIVSTFNPPSPQDLRGTSYWRFINSSAPLCLAKELDGTVLYGDILGVVASLENSFTGAAPIYFLSQYNFGQHPTQPKALGAFLMYVDTGNTTMTLQIFGLKEDGTILTYTTTFAANGTDVIEVDAQSTLGDCLAYAVAISGTTAVFSINYLAFIFVEEYPPLTFYAIQPSSNLGKDTLKKISKWGYIVNTLGGPITTQVTADGLTSSKTNNANHVGIGTGFWYQQDDIAAVDWQIELIAPQGMRFFKFMQPDVLQIYPPGRLLDQFGPLDLDREGIVFAFRIRCLNQGDTIHYKVYDTDDLVYENDITTSVNKDSTYEETLPKGINTSVFRMVITSNGLLFRHSLEVKVRTTGKETEQKWVKL